jgi:RNA polymerase sigma-B factor
MKSTATPPSHGALVETEVGPWFAELAARRPARVWFIGTTQGLAGLTSSLETRRERAQAGPRGQLKVKIFVTDALERQRGVDALGPLHKFAAIDSPSSPISVDVSLSEPRALVDLVSVGCRRAHFDSDVAVSNLRPGGRLLTSAPFREHPGLRPLGRSRLLFLKLPQGSARLSEGMQLLTEEQAPYEAQLLTEEQRQCLVKAHMSIARRLAQRFKGRGASNDDLEQVAFAALVASARRYDPCRGVPFAPYATQCILGELKRHFRDSAWHMRVPRRLQETYLESKKTKEKLLQDYGRTPTVPEVAAALGMSKEHVLEAIEAGANCWPESLDKPNLVTGEPSPLPSSEDPFERVLELHDLAQAWPRLTSLERFVLEQYFLHNRTQASIAQEIHTSQMQVSRLINRGASHLRTLLATE